MHLVLTSDFCDLENIGGAGRVLWELATRWVGQGLEVSVACGAPRAEQRRIEIPGGSIRWSSFRYETAGRRGLGHLLRTRRQIRALVDQLPSSVGCFVHNQPLTAEALRGRREPALYVFHSPWAMEYLADAFGESDVSGLARHGVAAQLQFKLRRLLESRALGRSNRIITLSRYMKEQVIALHGVDPARVRVVPGGTDYQRFKPDVSRRAEAKRRWQRSPEIPLLVCVRRLIPRTGVDLLLDAVARMSTPAQVLIAGRGPEAAALARQRDVLGLSDRVRFLGYVPDDDLADLYRAADLAVVPTRALEGFGLSTLEALASGTPVVATPVGGTVEILEAFDGQLLAAAVTAESLAASLDGALSDTGRLIGWRQSARTYAQDRFSWDAMAADVAHDCEAAAITESATADKKNHPLRTIRRGWLARSPQQPHGTRDA